MRAERFGVVTSGVPRSDGGDRQLSTVLEHISMLEELDTDAIPPTAQVIALQSVMRDDIVRPSLPQDLVLLNAPRQQEGYFRVNAVLDES